MPAAVPNGEADAPARFSLGYTGRGRTLGPHAAHLIVPFTPAAELTPFEQVQTFARILAAVLAATGGIAVYWSSAGATHPADFFINLAKSMDARRTTQRNLSRDPLRLPDASSRAAASEGLATS